MFTVGDTGNSVYEYALSTAFDISSSSLSYTDSVSISSQETSPREIKFNHDGTKMYISGSSVMILTNIRCQLPLIYHLLLPIKVVIVFLLQIVIVGPGFSFNNDGTKLFTTGSSNDRVNEHSLTTPFSLVDVSGEHSGDVINTSSTDNSDTMPMVIH